MSSAVYALVLLCINAPPVRADAVETKSPRADAEPTTRSFVAGRSGTSLFAAAGPDTPKGVAKLMRQFETIRVALAREPEEQLPGDTAIKDFFVQLPDHVALRSGSELRLTLHPSPEALSRICTINVSANDIRLAGAAIEEAGRTAVGDPAIRVRFPVPQETLMHGWNRITIQFVLRQPAAPVATPGTWLLRRSESYLSVAYERLRLFPELVRFPHSLVEEKQLRPRSGTGEPTMPVLAIFSPRQQRDVHLRACAIIGARLGQLGYVNAEDCRLSLVEDWQKESIGLDCLIVGLREELGPIPMPKIVNEKMLGLKPGQGLAAEFISGVAPYQKRRFLVTGADDLGLEKALLTIGHAEALDRAPPNPAIIDQTPSISASLEAKAKPSATKITLQELGTPRVTLTGIGHGEQWVTGWHVPPGRDLTSGGSLDLQFSHSKNLVSPASSFDVLVNGTPAGSVLLTPDNVASGSARVPLPAGLPGRDPMVISFRAHLDIGPVECPARREELPGLIVSGSSIIENGSIPTSIKGLDQLNRLLLRDSFLREAAFLLPENPSLDELQLLLALSLHLGRNLPSSPVLWPEVVTYANSGVKSATKLQNRSVLLLGSVAQWKHALPADTTLAIEMPDGQDEIVYLQGRKASVSAFELTLTLAHLIPSPWSQGQNLVAAGGWNGFATPTLKRMLTDPDALGKLYGNICAMDASDRVAAYDSRMALRDSFAERIQRYIPAGLTAEETDRQLAAQKAQLRQAGRINTIVFYACGGLFTLLVGCRMWFAWERARMLKTVKRLGHALETV